jgi:hypothetical protein
LLALLLAAPLGFAATKDADRPDREMLRMMEFLREMEMLREMELMRDMQEVEHVGDKLPNGTAPKSSPGKKKEAVK